MPESTGSEQWNLPAIDLYVNQISEVTGKTATFIPSRRALEVGDYGAIYGYSNEFEPFGNIFRNQHILEFVPELMTSDAWMPRTDDNKEQMVVITNGCEDVKDLGSSADATLQLQFEFKLARPGTFLVMDRPRSVHIPQPVNLEKLRTIPKLNGMHIVTGLVSCPAYALFHSYANRETVKLTLNNSSQCYSADSSVKEGWTWEGDDALHKDGYNAEGRHEYTPLLTLTEIRPEKVNPTKFEQVVDSRWSFKGLNKVLRNQLQSYQDRLL